MIRKLKSIKNRLEAQGTHIHHWLTEERKYIPTPIKGHVIFCMSHRLAAYVLVVFVGLSSLFGFLFNALFPITAALHAPSMIGMVETKVMHILVDLFGFYFVPRGFYGVMEHQLSGLRVFFYYALARICIFVPICAVQLILGNICDARVHGHTWVSPHEPAHPMRCSIMEMVELTYIGITFIVYAVLLQAYFNFWEQAEIELGQKKPNAGVGENTSLMPPPTPPGSQYPIMYSVQPVEGAHQEQQQQQQRRYQQQPPSYGHGGPGPGQSQLAYTNNVNNNYSPSASNYAPVSVPVVGPRQQHTAEYSNSYREYPAYAGYSTAGPPTSHTINPQNNHMLRKSNQPFQPFQPAPPAAAALALAKRAPPPLNPETNFYEVQRQQQCGDTGEARTQPMQRPSPRGRSPSMRVLGNEEEGNASQASMQNRLRPGSPLYNRLRGRPHSHGSQSSRESLPLSKEDKEYLEQRKISLGLGGDPQKMVRKNRISSQAAQGGLGGDEGFMQKKTSTMEEHEAKTHEYDKFLAARRAPPHNDLPGLHRSCMQQDDLGASLDGSSPTSKLGLLGSGDSCRTTELMTEGATNEGGSPSFTSATVERKSAFMPSNVDALRRSDSL